MLKISHYERPPKVRKAKVLQYQNKQFLNYETKRELSSVNEKKEEKENVKEGSTTQKY